ncbi:MAG TPA: copper resistance protein CopC [Dehalococcoidia bacterium]|nr:copper resistance protein CopC [Dehalococcoidia bacterium]
MQRYAPLALLALVALVLASAAAPMLARDASAHASLVRANPANNESVRRPPTRVVLNFSEPVERTLTEIKVTDKDGNRVDEGGTKFDDNDGAFASVGLKALEPGLYSVEWSNVSSVDGHSYSGRYPFIVLNPDGSVPAGASFDDFEAGGSGGELLPKNIDSALKWIALLSLATAAGAAFFLVAVLKPAASFLEEETYHKVDDAGERWVVTLSHVLLPASFIASAFLVLLTWNRLNTDTSLWTYLTSVRTGEYRLAGLVLVLIALAGADLLYLGGTSRKRLAGTWIVIAASLGAMFTYSMVSHGAGETGKVWSVGSDFLHFAASSAWLGALVMLPLLMWWRRRNVDDEQGFLWMANSFDRFSVIAGLSVATVLATGIFNGLVELPEWSAFVDTTYGKVLLAKLIIVAPLLAVAGLNAWVLKPRLVASIDGLYQEGAGGSDADRATSQRHLSWLQRWLPRTILLEIALVVAVFAAVGVLSQTSTAKGEIASDAAANEANTKFEQTSTVAGGLQMTLEVTPNRVGVNDYTMLLTDPQGAPLETITQARLRFTYEDIPDAIAPSELLLTKAGDGSYTGNGAYFTQPGNWRVEVGIRRSDGDDISQAYVLPVLRPEALPSEATGGIFDLPFTSLTWNETAGALLLLAGVMVFLYRGHLRGLSRPMYRGALTAGAAMLIAGIVLAFGVHTHTKAQDERAGNPVPPSQASIARGRELFQQNCVSCHGVDGRGDGPEAAGLNPAPTDFRLHLPLHTDPQFYAFIAKGYPGSAMPGFENAFSEEDIWNLVNFLRSFGDTPSQ